MSDQESKPYLKYALFCRDTEELADDDLILKGVIDLVDLPKPDSVDQDPPNAVLAEVDVNLVLCIGGVAPGPHRLLVAIKAPGAPLDPPPTEEIEWEEGILFQRWIKVFRIPVQDEGEHVAAILLDGAPLGEASFVVRFQDGA